MEQLSSTFYEKDATSFSSTRYAIWESVRNFTKIIYDDAYVLDAGCGNGKNMVFVSTNTNCRVKGVDKSEALVDICRNDKDLDVDVGDICNLHYADNTFDIIMSIAVVHHIETHIDRLNALNELLRVLKPAGKLLITCWAHEMDEYSEKRRFTVGDNRVPFKKSINDRFYYIFNQEIFNKFCNDVVKFQESSLENFISVDIFWEKGNWNAIFTKRTTKDIYC